MPHHARALLIVFSSLAIGLEVLHSCGGSGNGGSLQTPTTPPITCSGCYVWKPLRIGAGGYLTGLDIAPDGEKVVRADTYGAYRWNSSTSQWDQLVASTSMGESSYKFRGTFDGIGGYEIRIAPSNTQRYYMVWDGYIYRTDNRGASWTKTSFPRDTSLDANGGIDRYNGQKMAVDPADQDTVYFGTKTNGVWYTHDAGATWTQIATGVIPFGTAAPGHAGIAFDPTGGVNGSGYTNNIVVPSWGNGVWRTTNAGATWAQITGGPTTVFHAQVAADGIYYCADGQDVWKYSGGWTNISSSWIPDFRVMTNVASDPRNAARIVVSSQGLFPMRESYDRGATWIANDGWSWLNPATSTREATDIPWLAWTKEDYMSMGDMQFDPIDGKLYISEGIGVWKTTFPSTYVPMTWTSQSKGIEQLVANTVWSVPGGDLFVSSWDRPVFRVTDPDVYPSIHGPNRNEQINHGTSVEHARDDPSFIVVSSGAPGRSDQSSYSTDSGVTWTAFGSKPSGYTVYGGGHIAVRTKDNWVWAGHQDKPPYYTTNRGASWTACPSPVNVSTEWGFYLNRHIVTTDGSYFYLYVSSAPALYRSLDGSSWTTQYRSHIVNTADGYNAKLRAVPGKVGHLFYTNGPYGGGDHVGPDPGELFKRSTDGGVTWATVPGVLEVYDFGFGKEAAGRDYPTIFIAGFVNGVWGIWQSDDQGQSWVQVGDRPLGSLDEIRSVDGDMNVYGTVYVGFNGSGYAYGQLQ